MSGDGRHIYCSCYMANVGLLRSTDFLETAEPFKPDNCYSVYSIACNGRGIWSLLYARITITNMI